MVNSPTRYGLIVMNETCSAVFISECTTCWVEDTIGEKIRRSGRLASSTTVGGRRLDVWLWDPGSLLRTTGTTRTRVGRGGSRSLRTEDRALLGESKTATTMRRVIDEVNPERASAHAQRHVRTTEGRH